MLRMFENKVGVGAAIQISLQANSLLFRVEQQPLFERWRNSVINQKNITYDTTAPKESENINSRRKPSPQ